MAGGAISTQDAKTFIGIRSLWHFLLGRICIIGSLIPYRQICAGDCPLDCLCDWRRQWCESKMSTKEMETPNAKNGVQVVCHFHFVWHHWICFPASRWWSGTTTLFLGQPADKECITGGAYWFLVFKFNEFLMILSRFPTILISICLLGAW